MSDDTTQFRFTAFKPDTLKMIGIAEAIIAEYGGQKLTARQVYYQFVSRDLIPNTPRSYQNLTAMLTDARYAGMISWDAIEDRGREPSTPGEWDSIDDIVAAAMNGFRLPRWKGQPNYVEVWVEKQALAGVLLPITRRHHVTLMVNKGYSSASAMYESAMRMISACGARLEVVCTACEAFYDDRDVDNAKKCGACGAKAKPLARAVVDTDGGGDDVDREVHLLYLGDHDPSGEDMVRDIRDRLTEFGVPNLIVHKVALTMAQIKKFKPPPNPAKVTDSRAKAYIAEHGESSWELDALPPRELNRLVDGAIVTLLDTDLRDAVIAEEDKQLERLTKALAKTKGK